MTHNQTKGLIVGGFAFIAIILFTGFGMNKINPGDSSAAALKSPIAQNTLSESTFPLGSNMTSKSEDFIKNAQSVTKSAPCGAVSKTKLSNNTIPVFNSSWINPIPTATNLNVLNYRIKNLSSTCAIDVIQINFSNISRTGHFNFGAIKVRLINGGQYEFATKRTDFDNISVYLNNIANGYPNLNLPLTLQPNQSIDIALDLTEVFPLGGLGASYDRWDNFAIGVGDIYTVQSGVANPVYINHNPVLFGDIINISI